MIYEGPGLRIETDADHKIVSVEATRPAPSPAPPSTTEQEKQPCPE